MRTLRIASGVGFYGDSFWPAIEIIKQKQADYVCFEDLAELTLAILAKDMAKNPEAGYTKDLIPSLRAGWKLAMDAGIKIITNAGGLNPTSAGAAAARLAKELHIKPKIAVISGDSIFDRLATGEVFPHFERNDPLADGIRKSALFANAYLGARPIVEALRRGADLVITGRVADAALYLAPLAYEFEWDFEDLGRIAQGTVVGHILECSSQATGGNHGRDWESIDGLERIGFPIAEVNESGDATITKLADSGGRVDEFTVKEQLLYEIHNPFAYQTPDVVMDISTTTVQQAGLNRVSVTNTSGHKRPDRYKAIIGYPSGWMGQGILGYSWPDAYKKAQKTASIITNQLQIFKDQIDAIRIEHLGLDSLHAEMAASNDDLSDLPEVYLRIAIRTQDRSVAEMVSRMMVPLALSGPPTASGLLGFDRSRALIGLWPTLVERSIVDEQISIDIIEVAE